MSNLCCAACAPCILLFLLVLLFGEKKSYGACLDGVIWILILRKI
uniref:Uncharacterized protein n=1 Tax=Arundo donax TaxID=35708 RepID=A0A0A9CD26_ARUDO